MIWTITALAIAFSIFALSRAILRFKSGEISMRELLLWMALWIAIIFLSLVPDVASFISGLFGIERGLDLAVYLSIIMLFYLIFRMYVKIENLQHDITKLVREFARRRK